MSVLAATLATLGVAAQVFAAVGMVVLRDRYRRLHLLTYASSLGVPPVVAALAITDPTPGRATVKLVLVGVLLVVGGAVTGMAVARATAQREGRVSGESPQ